MVCLLLGWGLAYVDSFVVCCDWMVDLGAGFGDWFLFA